MTELLFPVYGSDNLLTFLKVPLLVATMRLGWTWYCMEYGVTSRTCWASSKDTSLALTFFMVVDLEVFFKQLQGNGDADKVEDHVSSSSPSGST